MGCVARIEYIVESERGSWTVRLAGGNRGGQFPSRRSALEAAVRDAVRVRHLGHEVHVLARRADGSLRRLPDQIHGEV